RPWTDEDAVVVAPSGAEPGVGKRSLINRFSVLVLNKELVDDHPWAWTDADIKKRSADLALQICEVWPGPEQFRGGSGTD
ncbi:MAG TPA: hypothetical protein VJ865_01950, partial [Gemmatimonadaceae bacterium]|nr:hypothetical protein [Gemmatimonadaceae bacterium]